MTTPDNANATVESEQQAGANAKDAYDDVSSDLAAADEDSAQLQDDAAQADGPTLEDGVEMATNQLQDLEGNCGPTLKTG